MDTETQKIISDQMKILPKNVVEAIVSVDYKSKLQGITQRQKLLIDQAGKLELETTLVMIGLEPLADYTSNLQRELGVSIEKAKAIAVDVSDNIFKPIRESLYQMNQEMEEAGDEEQEGTPEEPPPRSTDSNEVGLNRDQILNEIENPSLIGKNIQPATLDTAGTIRRVVENAVEVRPSQELETLDEVPYQQDLKNAGSEVLPLGEDLGGVKSSVLETKMGGLTITSQHIVDVKPEHKLPEVEKKRPSSGVDPYREAVM